MQTHSNYEHSSKSSSRKENQPHADDLDRSTDIRVAASSSIAALDVQRGRYTALAGKEERRGCLGIDVGRSKDAEKIARLVESTIPHGDVRKAYQLYHLASHDHPQFYQLYSRTHSQLQGSWPSAAYRFEYIGSCSCIEVNQIRHQNVRAV